MTVRNLNHEVNRKEGDIGYSHVSTLNLISGKDLLVKLNREKLDTELKKLKTR